MAISHIEYQLIRDMAGAGLFPKQPHVIEFGECNWYGDVSYQQLEQDIDQFVAVPELQKSLRQELERCIKELESPDPPLKPRWDIAKIFYQVFLNYDSITAIDLDGMETALKLDLNQPISLDRQFDLAINFGTAEHVFNVFQFFKTVHEVTKPGGLMLHGAPFQGWVDHGFFNFQPTFFWDLAQANGYPVRALAYGEMNPTKMIQIVNREQVASLVEQEQFKGNGLLFCVLQKPPEGNPFQTPQQGYYANTVSEQVRNAWSTLR